MHELQKATALRYPRGFIMVRLVVVVGARVWIQTLFPAPLIANCMLLHVGYGHGRALERQRTIRKCILKGGGGALL